MEWQDMMVCVLDLNLKTTFTIEREDLAKSETEKAGVHDDCNLNVMVSVSQNRILQADLMQSKQSNSNLITRAGVGK